MSADAESIWNKTFVMTRKILIMSLLLCTAAFSAQAQRMSMDEAIGTARE